MLKYLKSCMPPESSGLPEVVRLSLPRARLPPLLKDDRGHFTSGKTTHAFLRVFPISPLLAPDHSLGSSHNISDLGLLGPLRKEGAGPHRSGRTQQSLETMHGTHPSMLGQQGME